MEKLNRQPKGQSTGGQFAPSKNPEPSVDLERDTARCQRCGHRIYEDNYAGTGIVGGNVRNTYGCSGCGAQTHLDVDTPVAQRPVKESGPVSRELAIERIRQEFAYPGVGTDFLEPNDEGVDLINKTDFKLEWERDTPRGVAWAGEIDIDGEKFRINCDGFGPYVYSATTNSETTLADLDDAVRQVERGFPGLAGMGDTGALDIFVSLVQVAKGDE